MQKYRGIIYVLILLLVFSIVYWIYVYNALHQPGTPVEQDIFSFEEPRIRVRIINSLSSIHINFNDKWHITTGDRKTATDAEKGSRLTVETEKSQLILRGGAHAAIVQSDSIKMSSSTRFGELEIEGVPFGIGWWWGGRENRKYSGDISFYPLADGNIEVVIDVLLEDYLCGVVPYEMGADSPIAALQAQAVAARSEAVMALRSAVYSGPHYDLTSDVECQVFAGNNKRTKKSDTAVKMTQGIVLFANEKPMHAYYSSNCGGHSEKIENVWPDRKRPLPYQNGYFDSKNIYPVDLSSEKLISRWLASRPDVYCNPDFNPQLPEWSAKNFRWSQSFSTAALTRLIARNKDIGNLIEIKPLNRGVSGRISHVQFIGTKDTLDVQSELAIRQIWQPPLRSACFTANKKDGYFILNGAGWGHGVGMCQSGAISQANQGISFEDILMQYYRGAHLKQVY